MMAIHPVVVENTTNAMPGKGKYQVTEKVSEMCPLGNMYLCTNVNVFHLIVLEVGFFFSKKHGRKTNRKTSNVIQRVMAKKILD